MTDTTPPNNDPSTEADPTHTAGGAPTDQAHAEAGDGSAAGSTPAGLTVKELLEQAEHDTGADGGAG